MVVRSRADPLELENPQWFANATDFESVEVPQAKEAGDELRRVPGEKRLPGIGDLLHARHRRYGPAPCSPSVDRRRLSDHNLAGVEAHSHRKRETLLEANLVRVPPKLLLKMERGVTSTLRVILMGNGRREERHDAVAGVLVVPSNRWTPSERTPKKPSRMTCQSSGSS
jgi:hypothetical protein